MFIPRCYIHLRWRYSYLLGLLHEGAGSSFKLAYLRGLQACLKLLEPTLSKFRNNYRFDYFRYISKNMVPYTFGVG